jgi:putative DNA primase/helicase
MIDQAAIDRLRADTDLVALVGRSVKYVRRQGNEWWAPCPFHPDKTASFKASNERGRVHCFSCEFDADCIGWIQKLENCTFPEAVHRLSNGHAAPLIAPQQEPSTAPAKARTKLTPVMPVPADAPACEFEHQTLGSPTGTWTYRDAAGQLLGHVARYDPPGENRKIFQPYVWTERGWKSQGFPTPRPLYGLDRLAARPEAPVLVTEGEKCCTAAQLLLPTYVCVTWHGGGSAVKQSDWAPLKGREIVCWPDADDVGVTAMKRVVKIVGAGRVVQLPEGLEKGADLADDVWAPGQVQDLLVPPPPKQARGPMPEPQGVPALDPADMEPELEPTEPAGKWPFDLLGHGHGYYHYLPGAGGTVITLSGGGHTKANLMMLAPLNFWEGQFGCRDSKGWDGAANSLLQAQHRRGIFDPTALRGRGAWWDDGRVVIHLGNRLLVNGEPMAVRDLKTDFVYEIGPKIRHADVAPLSNEEAHRLIDLCKLISWERSVSAYLLAGWCVLAPICGALNWRPHIALSGPASAGKSWIIKNIVTRTLGQYALSLAASITEPGIRRALSFDARPVLVDEFEAKDELAKKRIEQVMGLMRYSSSETDAMIVKGSNSGSGVEFFKIRSMFCTAAIGSLINDYADRTRTSILSLKLLVGHEGAYRFDRIQFAQRELLTEAWVDGLHARTVAMIDTIRKNADTFAIAGAEVLGTRRIGDQLGTLLAGAFALTSRQAVTPAAAEKWLKQQDWSDEQEIIQDTDGPLCFARIMEHKVMVEAMQGGRVERSIGELVKMISDKHGDQVVSYQTATDTCRRNGVLLREHDMVAISNSHSAIAKILHDSAWAANWHSRLKTIKGAESSKITLSFGHAASSKAILVPRGSGE